GGGAGRPVPAGRWSRPHVRGCTPVGAGHGRRAGTRPRGRCHAQLLRGGAALTVGRPTLGDLTGRVCVITGATRGIGRATAERLAGLGATLALVCRRREEGEGIARELAGNRRTPPVRIIVADLSSQQSIREAAEAIRGRFSQLHVLVNNAGQIPKQRETTVDGLEMQFAVNHLAYFLLTNLLLEPLIAGAPSR